MNTIRPYKRNARQNENAIEPVANSIREFGFRSPIIATADGEIICGHTRYAAAQKLGLATVPVLYASDLSPAQVKAYRLADNKVAELAKWDNALLFEELEELKTLDEFAVDMSDFGFDEEEVHSKKRRQSWRHLQKLCNLKPRLKCHSLGVCAYTALCEVGKNGTPIEEIKADAANVQPFADGVSEHLLQALGQNISNGDWCLLTTPRRRHKSGMHFATEICKNAAKQLGLPFYVDALRADGRDRVEPKFFLDIAPTERNIILYDDILSTGSTVRACRKLLIDAGKIVMIIISINNPSTPQEGTEKND